jgi:ribonucleoside-diphosphate reductase alpha chain
MAKEFARIELQYLQKENSNHTNLSKYGKERERYLKEESIYELFKDFKYIIPQGSVMSNLGSKTTTSLSNCFVIGQPSDSYGGIFQKDEEMVQLMKRRGGVGIDISTLRPKGTNVTNAAKTSTGAISFMHRFSHSTREVAQDGRRGALMLSISINHPDVMDFIKIKRDLTQVTGANISIKLNNEFMKAVENDEDYILRFPCNHANFDNSFKVLTYNTLEPILKEGKNVGYVKRIKAKEYWDEIIKSAHNVAEPGLMFEDNHINYSPDGVYEQYKGITTNPCGEIFMQEYDACRLIAVNLISFVDNPFTEEARFNFDKFYEINYEAMRLSDDLVDLELEHIDRIINKLDNDEEDTEVKRREKLLWLKIKDTAQSSRRTGLGITALGDCLAALGLKYDSDESLEIIDKIFSKKLESELDCTIDLSILRGSFVGWDNKVEFGKDVKDAELKSKNILCVNMTTINPFYLFLLENFPKQAKRMYQFGRRNCSFNTCAPTGTVSLLANNCTGGIEPLFQPYYFRRKKINPNDKDSRVDFTDQNGDKWQEFPVLHPYFKEWIVLSAELIGTTLGWMKSLKDIVGEDFTELPFTISLVEIEYWNKETINEIYKLSPWYGSTANDINWLKRVEIQGIIQKYITHSISSTINLPKDVTEEEVSNIYMESWKKGLKGVTVYRDGSRSGVLITESNKNNQSFEYKDALKRPKSLKCDIHSITSKGIKWNVLVGLLDEKPYEVFAVKHFTDEHNLELVKIKQGRYDLLKNGETYSENITSEMNAEEEVITRLVSTGLRHGTDVKFLVEQLNKAGGDITSFSKAVSRILKKYIPEGAISTVKCEDCGSFDVIFKEGCQSCSNCG